MIGGVLAFASLIGGCMVAAIGTLLARYAFSIETSELWVWIIIAFVIGLAMTAIAMEVVASAVCSIFVCFAEDPQALQLSKPAVYAKFYTALTGHRYANKLHLTGVQQTV